MLRNELIIEEKKHKITANYTRFYYRKEEAGAADFTSLEMLFNSDSD